MLLLRPLTDTYNAAIGVCLDQWQQAREKIVRKEV